MKITFCLITLNEQENLDRCLRSCVELADEICIVDSGSTDGTEATARKYGARWEVRDWPGYVIQKNRVIDLATHEWVFSLDADEELSADLQTEIRQWKQHAAPTAVAGYSVPRCVPYEGRWIRHGDWYPDRLVRLFRRKAARFAGGKVHERLEINGRVVPLQGELHHYSFRDSRDHWERAQKYARLWAETQAEAGRTVYPWTPHLRGGFRWFRGYLLKRGFLDGRQGWRIASICAREVFYKYLLLRQINRNHVKG
jgi:glycosyltransferase involved in cell wall biosynthesis